MYRSKNKLDAPPERVRDMIRTHFQVICFYFFYYIQFVLACRGWQPT